MRAHFAVCLALCALVVAPGCLASTQRMFADILHDIKAGVGSKASPSSDQYRPGIKHLRLQEAKQYNCRNVGCVDVEECNNDLGCPDCDTHLVFQSDLTCCDDNKHPSPYPPLYDSPYMRIGTCDWDIALDSELACFFNPDEQVGCGNLTRTTRSTNIATSDLAERIGTAWATCYLASGAEECDDLLCDKMVLRFQGAFYATPATSDKIAGFATIAASNNASDFNPYDAQSCVPSLPTGLKPQDPIRQSNPTAEPRTGVALVATGTVSLTSMDRKVDYSYGTMDYVYDFASEEFLLERFFGEQAPTGELPHLTPNTYKLKLVEDHKSTY